MRYLAKNKLIVNDKFPLDILLFTLIKFEHSDYF